MTKIERPNARINDEARMTKGQKRAASSTFVIESFIRH
jgi:hypothetical protein